MIRVTFSVASVLTIYYIYSYCFFKEKITNKLLNNNIANTYDKSINKLEQNESASIKSEPFFSNSLINASKNNMECVGYRP